MQLSGPDSKEHRIVATAVGSLSLIDYDILDVVELGIGLRSAFGVFSSQPPEDIPSLFLAPDFAQPAW
jgi:hypothetical protein